MLEARASFHEMQYVFMGARMAGLDEQNKSDYRSAWELAALERKTGQMIIPLAGFYETVNQCVAALICSERATRHTLCRDATQLYDDLNYVKGGLEARYAKEKFQMITPHAEDRKRMYSSIRGLEAFATGCRKWNERHPQDKVIVSDGPRKAPP